MGVMQLGPAISDWCPEVVLKQDLLGRVERGHFASSSPPGTWVLRDTRRARWWARALAGLLARREGKGLTALRGVQGVPQLWSMGDGRLVRSWIAAAPLHDAQTRDPQYYRAARRLLVALHRRGVVHNDLAKEANWLVTTDGRPSVVDFQLAWVARRRSPLFRLAAREDLRHLLKHKRKYCGPALREREQRILAHRSWLARLWASTGKRAYLLLTRRLLRWSDREGATERQFPPA